LNHSATENTEITKALCPYFGNCGGCSFQDKPYAEQLEIKRKLVENELSPLMLEEVFEIKPVIPSPEIYHYRHMISMTVKCREGRLRLGFMGNDHRVFLPIERCMIADERLNQYLPTALSRLEALPPKRKFGTNQTALRIGDSGEVMAGLKEDAKKILMCDVAGKKFSYAMSSFFQHNFSILPAMAGAIRSLLNPSGEEILYDLYCGVGLFGILLADCYASVYGIEEGYESIRQAKENAKENRIENISFTEGKVEDLLYQIVGAGFKPAPTTVGQTIHIIVDPPRAGLKPKVIEEFLKVKIDRFIYVSCGLDVLRRDLGLLREGFQIKAVQPIDLFPQTKQIENIVLLEART